MLIKPSLLVIMISLSVLMNGLTSEKKDEIWWSLLPLKNFEIPEGDKTNPIDGFILSKLKQQGLKMSGKADRRVLIRRLYFNLWGMPPTQDEINNFINDPNPNAYRNLVDKLLASPRYGERWARHWLDVVHYGETHGYDKDKPRPNAWPYRDYVIRAFNNDKPYHQFIKEQIAGDILWPDTSDGIVATGFIAAGPWDFIGHAEVPESKIDGKVARHLDRDDMVTTTMNTFTSLTVQCAQCHDHPTDRWKQEQFHELAAFFPRVALRPQMDPRTFLVYAVDRFRFQPRMNNNRFIGTLEHRMPNFEDPATPGPEVAPKFFINNESLPLGTTDQDRRSALARWVTAKDNPWFAKATVNRVWAELVGEGFHEPVDDMGPDREATAPAAFDYLAGKFADSGYNMKWLIATIVSTRHYQLDSLNRRSYDQLPFQANTIQPLRSDQLMDAILNSLQFPELPERAEDLLRRQFSQTFGYDPNNLREEVSGSIPQALLLMNAPGLSRQITSRPGTMLGNLLNEVSSDRQAVQELYLKTLSRRPNRKELATNLKYIQQVGNRAEAFEDILWALINTSEFKTRN